MLLTGSLHLFLALYWPFWCWCAVKHWYHSLHYARLRFLTSWYSLCTWCTHMCLQGIQLPGARIWLGLTIQGAFFRGRVFSTWFWFCLNSDRHPTSGCPLLIYATGVGHFHPVWSGKKLILSNTKQQEAQGPWTSGNLYDRRNKKHKKETWHTYPTCLKNSLNYDAIQIIANSNQTYMSIYIPNIHIYQTYIYI